MGIRAKLVLYAILTAVFVMQGAQMPKIASANESNETKIKLSAVEEISFVNNINGNTEEKVNNTNSYELRELIQRELGEDWRSKVAVSKKPVPVNINLPKGKFMINASAYTAAADECGKSDGITASGKKVKENETIACPKSFAFGTKINIEGYGTYICQDRGGAIKGNKIDIYVETKAEAFAFGRRELVAEIIE